MNLLNPLILVFTKGYSTLICNRLYIHLFNPYSLHLFNHRAMTRESTIINKIKARFGTEIYYIIWYNRNTCLTKDTLVRVGKRAFIILWNLKRKLISVVTWDSAIRQQNILEISWVGLTKTWKGKRQGEGRILWTFVLQRIPTFYQVKYQISF